MKFYEFKIGFEFYDFKIKSFVPLGIVRIVNYEIKKIVLCFFLYFSKLHLMHVLDVYL